MISLNVIEPRVNGVVLWRGKSLLNGEPIVVVATGLRDKSENKKTGDFIQTYILSDGDERPTDALKSGADAAVCGNCVHRQKNGWGTCYVNLGQGPNSVYAALNRGAYPYLNAEMVGEYFSRRIVRLGSYGDPAAVPVEIWRTICVASEGWTGYTHQWRKCDPELKQFCMASVETPEQQKKARAMGWKTFRVRNVDEPLQKHEFVCPASHEAGKKLKCEDCLACSGGEWNGSQFTPVIVVHGTTYKAVRFRIMQKRMRNKKKFRHLPSTLIGIGAFKGRGAGKQEPTSLGTR